MSPSGANPNGQNEPMSDGVTAIASEQLQMRRRWYQRIGVAVFIWALESLIGMIPFIAHAASRSLVNYDSSHQANSDLPELCVLSVVASGLALLSLLRDWFKGEATEASALTLTLGIANFLACLAGAFLYPVVSNGLLVDSRQEVPAIILVTALGASLLLAAERGFNQKR